MAHVIMFCLQTLKTQVNIYFLLEFPQNIEFPYPVLPPASEMCFTAHTLAIHLFQIHCTEYYIRNLTCVHISLCNTSESYPCFTISLDKMLRDFVTAQMLRTCYSFYSSLSSLISQCRWRSWEHVITVPAVLSEGFVISGLVLISVLSSLLCEWMWITGFYRIRCSSNSMYCVAVSLLFAQCLYWVGEELCKVCRCLSFLLWRTSFSFEIWALHHFVN